MILEIFIQILDWRIYMVKLAYSFEKDCDLTAQAALDKYKNKHILDKTKFICADKKNCGIPLTATGWDIRNPKRIYYTLSDKSKNHTDNCKVVLGTYTTQEQNKQNKAAYETKKTNTLKIIPVQTYTKKGTIISQEDSDFTEASNKKQANRNTIDSEVVKKESTHTQILQKVVSYYNDPSISTTNFALGSEKLSLKELFITDISQTVYSKTRIFTGFGEIKTSVFNSEVLEIKIDHWKDASIFTNKKALIDFINSRIDEYIDTEKKLKIFFLGSLPSSTSSKFESYNIYTYHSLWFEI